MGGRAPHHGDDLFLMDRRPPQRARPRWSSGGAAEAYPHMRAVSLPEIADAPPLLQRSRGSVIAERSAMPHSLAVHPASPVILAVENEPAILAQIAAALRNAEYLVITAENGTRALDAAEH